MKKVNFAVIGFGHIGKRHVEMIKRNPYSEIVAIVDVNENLKNYSAKIPFFKTLDDLFVSDLEIDVINIATPNGFHTEHALKALSNNLNVVIEKPMSLNTLDAKKIINKSIEVNKYVFTVMQNRYSPPSKWLKDIMINKILGDIYMVQLNCYWNRDERYYTKDSWHGDKKLDGGTLFTQFSHFIDLLYWLFGDIINIKTKLMDFNHNSLTDFEDSGTVSFEFVDGGIGTINFSTSVYQENLESSLTIIGQNGSIKVGGQYMNKVEYCNIKNYDMPKLKETRPGNDYGSYKGSAQNHDFVINNVVNVLNNKEKIKTNSFEGMKVVEIIEKIYNLQK